MKLVKCETKDDCMYATMAMLLDHDIRVVKEHLPLHRPLHIYDCQVYADQCGRMMAEIPLEASVLQPIGVADWKSLPIGAIIAPGYAKMSPVMARCLMSKATWFPRGQVIQWKEVPIDVDISYWLKRYDALVRTKLHHVCAWDHVAQQVLDPAGGINEGIQEIWIIR